ncbi:MAG: ribosomal RNA small subunit methyltransferase A [Chlamydiia bacterium]|nr:ribosomal RNA small subunit methyltransferase A [Chlamydiia bacterium]
MSLYKPSKLAQFLAEKGIKPKKGLSQNFLIDGNILRKLIAAANLSQEDTVLEIGPGPGVLTEALLEAGAHVIAIEKDENLARNLERLQNGNLTILADDFRNIRFKRLLKDKKKVKVIANIPYHITGIILQELLPQGYSHIESIHIMVQKEVALRCQAPVGTKDYSSFTLFTQYHAQPKLLFTVSPSCFYPPPKVESAILELKLHPPPVEAPYEPLFQIIRTAFQMRRKMLRTSLKSLYPPEKTEQALETLGFVKTTRPQELSLKNFSALFFSLETIQSEKSEHHSDA